PAWQGRISSRDPVKENGPDAARCCHRSWSRTPSTAASRMVTSFISEAALAWSSCVVAPPHGVQYAALISGKRIAFPAGIVQVRVALPPVVSARNQTGPDWPLAASAPVPSRSELLAFGIASTHFHQAADHSG